jgi:hypothetical protein
LSFLAAASLFFSVPILNADRFLTGLVTQSMLISLISQVSRHDRHRLADWTQAALNADSLILSSFAVFYL